MENKKITMYLLIFAKGNINQKQGVSGNRTESVVDTNGIERVVS